SMRNGVARVGNSVFALGLIGLVVRAGLTWGPPRPHFGAAPKPAAAVPAFVPAAAPAAESAADAAASDDSNLEAAVLPDDPQPELGQPEITHVAINSIKLDTDVVPAPYSEADGGTWEIPKFVAGHAEYTAGAGQRGNAVLFGH